MCVNAFPRDARPVAGQDRPDGRSIALRRPLGLLACLCALLCLPGCVVTTAARATGAVAGAAVKTTVFTAKTTGKAAGAVIPGGGKSDEERRDRR